MTVRALAFAAALTIALGGCGRDRRASAGIVGCVAPIAFDDARSAAVPGDALRIRRFAREHPLSPNEVWGRDEDEPLREDLECSFPAGDDTVTLSRAVMEGICDIGEVRWYRDHDALLVSLHGGDAAGSYLAVFRLRGAHVDRFIESGEMGEEFCESAAFEHDEPVCQDRHSEWHDD